MDLHEDDLKKAIDYLHRVEQELTEIQVFMVMVKKVWWIKKGSDLV